MIEQFTPLQAHRETVRQATLNCLVEADHLASAMLTAYGIFWDAPTETVLEMLNSNVAFWLDVLQRNTAVGTTINAQLDAANLPQFSHRVPVTMPEGYSFSGVAFTYSDSDTNNAEDDANDDPISDDSYEFFAMNGEPEPLENDNDGISIIKPAIIELEVIEPDVITSEEIEIAE
jgi:hypothetical protein